MKWLFTCLGILSLFLIDYITGDEFRAFIFVSIIYFAMLFEAIKCKKTDRIKQYKQAEEIARRFAHEQKNLDKLMALFWERWDAARRNYNNAKTSHFGCNMSREQYEMKKRLEIYMNHAKINYDHAVKLHQKGDTNELIQYAKQVDIRSIPFVTFPGDMQPKDPL